MSRFKLGQNELSLQIFNMSHPSKHLQHAQYGNKLYSAVSSSWFNLGLKSKIIPLATQVWKEWICVFVCTVQQKIIQWLLETQSEWVYGSGKQCKDVFTTPALFGERCSQAGGSFPEVPLVGIPSASCKDSTLPTGPSRRKAIQNCSFLSQESIKILRCLFFRYRAQLRAAGIQDRKQLKMDPFFPHLGQHQIQCSLTNTAVGH